MIEKSSIIFNQSTYLDPPRVSNFSPWICFWWLRGSNFTPLEDSGRWMLASSSTFRSFYYRSFQPIYHLERLMFWRSWFSFVRDIIFSRLRAVSPKAGTYVQYPMAFLLFDISPCTSIYYGQQKKSTLTQPGWFLSHHFRPQAQVCHHKKWRKTLKKLEKTNPWKITHPNPHLFIREILSYLGYLDVYTT